MKNLLDTEGTVLFPFQTEIHLFGRFSPPLNAWLSEPGTIFARSNTGAPVSVFCFLWPMWVSVLRWSGL